MALSRHNTLTMFRDDADTNAVFTIQNFDGSYGMHIDKIDDDTGEAKSLFMLASQGVDELRDWAASDELSVTVPGHAEDYYLVIKPSSKFPGGVKLVKRWPNGGKPKTLLVLTEHQTKRLTDWLERIK